MSTLSIHLKQTTFRLDAKVFFWQRDSSSSGDTLLEAYRKDPGLSSSAELVIQPACFATRHKAPCDPMVHMWNRRRDLTGVVLKTAAHAPEKRRRRRLSNARSSGEGTVIKGLYAELFYGLESALNFTCKIEAVKGGAGHREGPNRTWTGVLGMLARKEIDVSMTAQVRCVGMLGRLVLWCI